MATYGELQTQLQQLQQAAEEARLREMPEVIATIQGQIEEYKLKPSDIFPYLTFSNGETTISTAQRRSSPKYRGPNGETWAGGSGRKPDWVRALLEKGEDLEKYAV